MTMRDMTVRDMTVRVCVTREADRESELSTAHLVSGDREFLR